MKNSGKEKRDQQHLTAGERATLVIGAVGILVLLSLTYFVVPSGFGPISGPGVFGDMFGATNALFSGLAFLGVVLAILLQRRELQLQREELEETRDEIKRQREALEAQVSNAQRLNFDSTFFQLLDHQQKIVDSLKHPNGKTTGRDTFGLLYGEWKKNWSADRNKPDGQDSLARIDACYGDFYARYHSRIGHYFRHLYQIVKFVAERENERPRFYVNLLRAQISSQEALLLFYNCLSRYGSEKFKPLVEHFALLEHMPIDELPGDGDHAALYDESAFGLSFTSGEGPPAREE